ncbi:MAG: molybdate ABC transporter substrate-binding protein [Hyphomicrobiaceae bacterium]|nr:molybdate ABC transporter substrate-binding protein [Hyphomicrobiaceae bacterium]
MSHADAGRVTVFAAASLKNALDELAGLHEAETGTQVLISYAGSSALARQIEAGAPADIFMSANTGWMDHLEAAGLIDRESRRNLLANRLVLIARRDGEEPESPPAIIGPGYDLVGLVGEGRLAVALVDAVPAGIYASEALTALGARTELEPRLVQTDNVRAALRLVALGEAMFGIVYESDARAEPLVMLAGIFAAETHAPILYPAARVQGRDNPAADVFLAFLASEGAQAIFARHGFARPGEARP